MGAAAAFSRLRTIPGVASGGAPLTLTAVGDCLIARRVSSLRSPGFLELRDLLRASDCTWGNCEIVFADPQDAIPVAKGEDPLAICETWGADELHWTGVNFVGVANNHALDYGADGLHSTIRHLDRVGIVHAGAGDDLGLASRPAYLDTNAGRVGQVNCASTFPDFFAAGPRTATVRGRPGINPLHPDWTVVLPGDLFGRVKDAGKTIDRLGALQEFDDPDAPPPPNPSGTILFGSSTIREGDRVDLLSEARESDRKRITGAIGTARNNCRVVIATIHSHEARERLEVSDLFLPPFAHACIDAGADAYFAAGPHVMRGIEVYKGKPIFYSLGNFFFQYESEIQVPPESLSYYGLDPAEADPWQFNRKILYYKQKRFWQSFVPRITFDDRRVTSVEIHPITLGFSLPVDVRGTPERARGASAREILDTLAELSAPFGTKIDVRGDTGYVSL
jgi:poly-gamma-glutamate synthesis protein (capsule biosynthesis protein)